MTLGLTRDHASLASRVYNRVSIPKNIDNAQIRTYIKSVEHEKKIFINHARTLK